MATKRKIELENNEKNQKFLLWLGIGSISMIFAGLTSSYLVKENSSNWFRFDIPQVFWVSTAILILSSGTMYLAQYMAGKNKFGVTSILLFATLVLGLIFTKLQFNGWEILVAEGIHFADPKNVSGSLFYVLTGLHLAHLAGGLFVISFTTIKSLFKKYTAENYLGIKLCGMYWHFMDILWIYLFVFLLLKG
jgi:cytochrome c oxidase subunit 3